MSLNAAQLTVTLGGTTIVSDVTVGFDVGTLTAVMGPNGAGKTTLIRALAVDVATAAGEVRWGEEDIGRWHPGDLALLRSFLTQDGPTDVPFPVRAVVAMGRTPYQRTGDTDRETDDRIVGAAMAAMEVLHLADRPFRELSGGERSRVSLARILAQDAPVILLDEPTAALDLGHRERILARLRAEAAAGRTVVSVLHDLNLAAVYADRIVFIDEGRIVADGAPAEVLRPDLLTALYDQPMAVIDHPFRDAPLVITTD